MELTRRDLLKLTGLGLGAVLFAGCRLPQRELLVQSPALLPEDLVTGLDNWYATLCRFCPTGEGILVRVMEGRAKKVEGNPDYPIGQGKHSARCEAALQALYHPDRLPGPRLRDPKTGDLFYIGWDAALDELVGRLQDLRSQAGSVLFITGPLRGHLALVVKRFVETYGARHLVLEPVEQTVLRAAIKKVFGQDRLPEFDIRNTRVLLSVGADFLGSWLSPTHYGTHYGEFRQGEGRERGLLIQVEPRLSLTGANADRWLPIHPGTEGVLAWSIAYVLIREGLAHRGVARALTQGRGASYLEAFAPERAEKITGIPAGQIEEAARLFGQGRPALAIGGGPAAASTNGLFNLTAIYTLNLLVDNIGKPGGVQFNPPPPLDLPQVNGSPFRLWREEVERARREGPPAMVLVYGADPAHALPASLGFQEEVLGKTPFLVSFSPFVDDTAADAHLILPIHTPLEEWGDDVPDPGPGYQVLGLGQPVVRPFLEERREGGSRPFADILLTVAEEVGPDLKEALPWPTFRDLLREGAQRLFQEGRGSVRAPTFEAFWVGVLQRGGWWDTQARGPAQAPLPGPAPREPVLPRFEGEGPVLIPFASHLLEGQVAHLPWLQALPDPLTTAVWGTWVEVSLPTARRMGLREGDIVRVESPAGTLEAPVYVHPGVPPGVVAIPLGQGHREFGRYAERRGANPWSLLPPVTEGETGALAWVGVRVRLVKTGRRVRIPKFEGTVFPIQQLSERPIVQVARPEEAE